jgi:hypothetical protein
VLGQQDALMLGLGQTAVADQVAGIELDLDFVLAHLPFVISGFFCRTAWDESS